MSKKSSLNVEDGNRIMTSEQATSKKKWSSLQPIKWISQPFHSHSQESRNCFLCSAPNSEFKCSWCQSIYYCSKEHYVHHRMNSKCYPFTRVGNALITSRNVHKGEVLLSETSLLNSPSLHSPPTCPSCLKRLLSEKRSIPCPQGCPLRLCTGPCSKQKGVHGPECKILRENKVKLDFQDYAAPMPINSVIAVLRLLDSKKKRPADWKNYFNPQSIHMEERRKARGEWEWLQKDVVNFIRGRLFMASDVGDEELHLLLGLFVLHSTPLVTGGGKALFPIFSLIDYDCIGNCRFSVNPKTSSITVRARSQMELRERLTVNFAPSVLGTLKRRKRLKSLYYFDCTCIRCTDPTECGTFVSAISCEACSDGIMLPNRPLEPLSEWSCSHCDFLLGSREAEGIIDRSEDELTEVSVKKNLRKLEDFISHYEGKILHRNHYLLLLAKRNYVLISRKDKINSLASSQGTKGFRGGPSLRKEELYEDFWWIIETLGIEDCF